MNINPFLHINDIASLTGYEFESACRHFTSYALLGNNRALCRILTRYKIYIDTRDESIVPHLVMDGFWEQWLSQALARIIKPGDNCLDIGANMGYYSVLMSALSGDRGRTVAVEPNPAICQLLRASAGINYPGFSVAECALSNKAGKMVLHIPDNYSGDASLIERPLRVGMHRSKVKVETITLDSLLDRMDMRKIDVIKMDVEGAEPMVFEGMTRMVAENPGLRIIIEYSPHLYADPVGFTRMLFKDFNVHRIGDEMEVLQESAMEELLKLTSHKDLYLTRK